MSVIRGLDAILSGGTSFVTFEEGKPMTLLFVDWYEDLMAVREHYESSLNPKYIRCPGKEVCPLCQANPDKYPSLKIKFRVYDPTDNKVKIVSMAKKHVQKLNTEFNLDEVDPTQTFVTVFRSGKGASDTSYSVRIAKGEFQKPDFDAIEMPDLGAQVKPHTTEEIQGFMNALLQGATAPQGNTGAQTEQSTPPQGFEQPKGDPNTSPTGRKLPF